MVNRNINIFLALVLVFGVALSGCSSSEQTPSANAGAGVTTLTITDVVAGEGAEAVPGKMVSVHYSGWLYDDNAVDKKGEKFDSSLDRGQPFGFRLGAGQVIKGWDQGVVGMKVGGQRTLMIPPDFGYGSRGAGRSIPPDASLLFEVELLNIR